MKEVVVVKDKDEEGEKTKNNWVDVEILHLILSHVNHTFFILDPQIGPQTFKHTHGTLTKNVF
jgi:hypothetical protein